MSYLIYHLNRNIIVPLALLCVLAAAALAILFDQAFADTVTNSGQTFPRFASIKANRANVRLGPTTEHDITWTFVKSGTPIEIIQEFDNWYRIRDVDGQEGWLQKIFVAKTRTAIITPWLHKDSQAYDKQSATQAMKHPNSNIVVAVLMPRVMVRIVSCDGTWCQINALGYWGYVEQGRLWGVYPGEVIE